MGDVNVGELEEDELNGVEMDGMARVCWIIQRKIRVKCGARDGKGVGG